MPSKAKKSFDSNKADVERLWEIHGQVGGDGVGRKHRVEILNRAAVVFITSCWEAYVEDVALEGFDFLLAKAKTSESIPSKVKALVGEQIRDDEDRRAAWKLADEGWRAVLQAHRDTVRQTWLGKFNTPKAEPVALLFERMVGLKSLPDKWKWKGMGAEQARKKLDKYIKIRGQVVHRVKHDDRVYKNWGTNYLGHIERLVSLTDTSVRDHLRSIVGKNPWT